MITKTAVPNAVNVLPKSLLAKLQRYCSGSIYIPAPQTQAQMNMTRVRLLHSRGWRPTEIAEAAGMSAKQVRHIIKEPEAGGISSPHEHKVYEAVPQEIVEAVQKYVCGRLYVPERYQSARMKMSARCAGIKPRPGAMQTATSSQSTMCPSLSSTAGSKSSPANAETAAGPVAEISRK